MAANQLISDADAAFDLLGTKEISECVGRYGKLVEGSEGAFIEVQPLGWDNAGGGPWYADGSAVMHPIDPAILPELKQKIADSASAQQEWAAQHHEPSVKTTASAWD